MRFFSCLFLVLFAFSTTAQIKHKRSGYNRGTLNGGTLQTGAENFAQYIPLLRGKSVAVFANQTSVTGKTHLVDTLRKMGITITVIFAPEHGFRGTADAGEKVGNYTDQKTGIPVVSLYGTKRKPSKEDLANVDIMLFDIQDVGVRFYTFISSLEYYIEAAMEFGKHLIILDRPNPNGHYVDGPVLEAPYKSFVGMQPVPVVYGMTIGEYAQMIYEEEWLDARYYAVAGKHEKFEMTVIPCNNYTHTTKYDLPVKPSPNLPNIQSIWLYPSTCFFEGTTLSLGRGTDKQFQVIGHPKLKSDFSFTPKPNEGAKEPPLNGQLCYGEDLSQTTIGSIIKKGQIDLSYLINYHKKMSSLGEKYFLDNNFLDKLAGSDQLRTQISQGKTEAEIRASWAAGLEKFKKIRAKYLLY